MYVRSSAQFEPPASGPSIADSAALPKGFEGDGCAPPGSNAVFVYESPLPGSSALRTLDSAIQNAERRAISGSKTIGFLPKLEVGTPRMRANFICKLLICLSLNQAYLSGVLTRKRRNYSLH